jgi:hypothetical protein
VACRYERPSSAGPSDRGHRHRTQHGWARRLSDLRPATARMGGCGLSMRARKPSGASPQTPPANERAEVETMARRLEELRRSASNSVLRGAYLVAIEALDAVVYRLRMLRALEAPARHQARGSITSRRRRRLPRPLGPRPRGSVRHASGDRDACGSGPAARTGIGRQPDPADAGSVGRPSWDHRTGGTAG